MSNSSTAALHASDIKSRSMTTYPKPFRAAVAGRSKRVLGDPFGLSSFGVNLVELAPGAWSSQRHWHTHEDEFVYVVAGELTLVTNAGEQTLTPGMVVGFPAAASDAHHLVNNSDSVATYLEIGTRVAADEVFYPDIDLRLASVGDGSHRFTHRDGTPYDQDR